MEFHGPPTLVSQGPCSFDEGRSLVENLKLNVKSFTQTSKVRQTFDNLFHNLSRPLSKLNFPGRQRPLTYLRVRNLFDIEYITLFYSIKVSIHVKT